jgi:aconitate hydratase/homoaconitate hydratase
MSPNSNGRRPMTLTEKILLAHALGHDRPDVAPGEEIRIAVDWTIASELAWNGMNQTYEKLGRPQLHDPDRFYLAIDHTVDPGTLATDPRAQRLAQLSRDFARESGIRHFYDANVTILHTKFYRDLVRPGDVVLGADSHTSSHGGLGAFSIGLGGADITMAMVSGESWIQVPEAIRVDYRGRVPFGLTGKDVILRTLGLLGRNTVAMERTVEFSGDELAGFSADFRFTVANMTAEFGGLNGIFPADEVTRGYVERREDPQYRGGLYFRADPDARYLAVYPIELTQLVPQVAKPFSPDNVVNVEEVEGGRLDGCFIGACTTTEEELVLAGLVLEAALGEGTPVAASTKRLVVPGSLEIAENLRRAGLLEVYERAGFRVGVPGCSMCLGIASDKALPGENWLSSQNRNFENRMGKGSLAWLASAPTVAASALELRIRDPRPLLERVERTRLERILGRDSEPIELESIEPADPAPLSTARPRATQVEARGARTGGHRIRGRVQLFGDHVDTDAIIPGEFCHLSKLDEIGQKAFLHVRPQFPRRVREGRTVIVGGEGWGSGSSREQAAWALKGAGVELIIAKSFAFIHKRNLVNEAIPYLVLDDPEFYKCVEEDAEIEADLESGEVLLCRTDQRFIAQPPAGVSKAIQEAGGLVPAGC